MKIKDVINEITQIPDFDDNLLAARSKHLWPALLRRAEKVANFNNIEIWKTPDDYFGWHYFIMDENEEPICKASIGKISSSTVYINHIWMKPEFRGKGIGYLLYKYILTAGFRLLSDTSQTIFAKSVWSKLAKEGLVYEYDSDSDHTDVGKRVKNIERFYKQKNKRLIAFKK